MDPLEIMALRFNTDEVRGDPSDFIGNPPWNLRVPPRIPRLPSWVWWLALPSRLSWQQCLARHGSIGWFKGKITGKSHISWENLWFPVDFPLSQPIEWLAMGGS